MLKLGKLAGAAALAALTMFSGAAFAADYVLKGGTGTGDSTALGRAGDYFKEIIEERSGGRIGVTWYPNGQLGGEVALLNQLNDGILQFATLSTAVSSSLNPKLDVMYLPYFLPKAWDSFYAFAKSDAAPELLGLLEKNGITGLAFIPYGADALAYNGPVVRKPADAAGIKLRSAESVNVRLTLNALGFNAVPLAWTETYQSIQTKVVDGLSTPPTMILQARFHEVIKNAVITEHLFGQHVFWISSDVLKGMPEDLQKMVREAAAEASDRAAKELREGEAAAIADLESKGVVITRVSDEEIAAFRAATTPVVRDFEKRINDQTGDGREFMSRIYGAIGQNYEEIVGK